MNPKKNASLDASRLETIAKGYEVSPNDRRIMVARTLRNIAARLRGGGCKRCECENPGLGGTANILECRECPCHREGAACTP